MVTAAEINSRISMMRKNQEARRQEIKRNIELIRQRNITDNLKRRLIGKELSRFKGAAVEKQIQQLEAKLRKAQFQAARRQRKEKTPEEAERLRRESAKRAPKRRAAKKASIIRKAEVKKGTRVRTLEERGLREGLSEKRQKALDEQRKKKFQKDL